MQQAIPTSRRLPCDPPEMRKSVMLLGISCPVVMRWLEAGYSIVTIYQCTDKIWAKGADVAIWTGDGNPVSASAEHPIILDHRTMSL